MEKDELKEETAELKEESAIKDEASVKEGKDLDDVKEEKDLDDAKDEKDLPEEDLYTGKEAVTSVLYDEKTLKTFNMYHMVVRKKIYLSIALLVLLCSVTFIVILIKTIQKFEAFNLVFLGIFFVFACLIAAHGFRLEKDVDKVIINHFTRNKPEKIRIRIREDKIILLVSEVHKKGKDIPIDWALISRIDEIDEYFYLYLNWSGNKNMPVIISKDPAMAEDGAYSTIEEIIEEKIKSKPYYYCKKKICKLPIPYVERTEDNEGAQTPEDVQESDMNDIPESVQESDMKDAPESMQERSEQEKNEQDQQ